MKLSIITPSFNYARWIDDCLSSVMYQDRPAHEHLVIDDGSSDDSVERISAHPSAPVLTVQPNAGLAATLNRLTAQSEGDWVGWCNADDFYLPSAFETVAGLVEKNPKIDVFVGDTVFVDPQGCVERLLPTRPVTRRLTRLRGISAAPSAIFVRGDLLRQIGFREGTTYLMDVWLFADLLDAGARFASVPVPLGAMRRHRDQVSATLTGDAARRERDEFQAHVGLPRSRAGLSVALAAGGALHCAAKLGTGAYVRQARWSRRRGESMIWWQTRSSPPA